MNWSQLNWDCAAHAASHTRATDKAALVVKCSPHLNVAAAQPHSGNYGNIC